MADISHLRCRHCGEPMQNNPWPYCGPCNFELCYKAMPILLGMLMTSHIAPVPAVVSKFNRKSYEHLRYIMD